MKNRALLKAVPDFPSKQGIPLIKADLPALEEVAPAFREILSTGKISNFGKYLNLLEEELKTYLDCEVALVSSGTMGLIFLLQSLELKPGDKVLLPSFSFMATAQAILYAGGTPVFAEIDDDMTLSVQDLERQLHEHPEIAAVIGVHTYGLPAKVKEIEKVVRTAAQRASRRIPILYDAAHAFGATINGERVGRFGDGEVFSLSVTKTLVCVEGGLVSSRDANIIRRIKKMRNYGIEENYDAHYPGLNGKMSEFHAAIGLHNLKRIDWVLTERTRLANYYSGQIASQTGFIPLPVPSGVTHTFKDFTVFLPKKLEGKRTEIMGFLKDKGIETRAYFFPPIHEQKYFKRFCTRPLPQTGALSRRVLTLPFFTTITKEEIDRVVSALKEAEGKLA